MVPRCQKTAESPGWRRISPALSHPGGGGGSGDAVLCRVAPSKRDDGRKCGRTAVDEGSPRG